jgi:hypothetical protein
VGSVWHADAVRCLRGFLLRRLGELLTSRQRLASCCASWHSGTANKELLASSCEVALEFESSSARRPWYSYSLRSPVPTAMATGWRSSSKTAVISSRPPSASMYERRLERLASHCGVGHRG